MKFRFIKISIPQFVVNMLPPHKRQANRISWINGLTSPLVQLMNFFLAFRQDAIIRANVTGQTISLQWYLNYCLDNQFQRIIIINELLGGFTMGLRSEGLPVAKQFSLTSESPIAPEVIPLKGENPEKLPFNFRVVIPNSVDKGQVAAIVNKYKLAGRSYDIITNG